MENPIKLVYRFNKQAGLLEQGYSDTRECAYPIEEALEDFDITRLNQVLGIDSSSDAKTAARAIISLCDTGEQTLFPVSDVKRLDKHIDQMVFAPGSVYKLGLSPQQLIKAFNVVMRCNLAKLSAGKDSHGKQLKPEGWVGPEAELQKILNERPSNVE